MLFVCASNIVRLYIYMQTGALVERLILLYRSLFLSNFRLISLTETDKNNMKLSKFNHSIVNSILLVFWISYRGHGNICNPTRILIVKYFFMVSSVDNSLLFSCFLKSILNKEFQNQKRIFFSYFNVLHSLPGLPNQNPHILAVI